MQRKFSKELTEAAWLIGGRGGEGPRTKKNGSGPLSGVLWGLVVVCLVFFFIYSFTRFSK